MQNRKLDVEVNSKLNLARQVAEHEVGKGEAQRSPLTQHDPMSQVVCRLGDASCSNAHASALQRAPASRPIGGAQSLLQLQRQYGNRFVQRVMDISKKNGDEVRRKLTVNAAGDRYEQEADRVARAIDEVPEGEEEGEVI